MNQQEPQQQSGWRGELRVMLDKNIAVDGGAVATKYYWEIENLTARVEAEAEARGRRAKTEEIFHDVFKSSIPQWVTDAVAEGHLAGLQEAVKCMPTFTGIMPEDFKDGVEYCRNQTLANIKKLMDDHEKN